MTFSISFCVGFRYVNNFLFVLPLHRNIQGSVNLTSNLPPYSNEYLNIRIKTDLKSSRHSNRNHQTRERVLQTFRLQTNQHQNKKTFIRYPLIRKSSFYVSTSQLQKSKTSLYNSGTLRTSGNESFKRDQKWLKEPRRSVKL